MAKKILLIILLFALIILPRIGFGIQSEKKARQALRDGDFTRAAEEFETAKHRLFWRDDLWSEIGKAKLMSGQKTDALVAYENARQANTLSAFGWDILGRNQWEQGNRSEALSIWQEGLFLYPNYIEFYAHIAMTYRENDDFLAEGEMLEEWLKYEDNAEIHYRLGLLLFLDDTEKARDELTYAARVDKQFAPAVETLRASLNLASLESDPAESTILLGRGLALVEEWQLAENLFYNATQAYPENASAWAWLGEAKQHLEKDPLPDLEKASNLQPNSVLIRSLWGLYWQRQGNWDEALSVFQEIAELEPENPSWQSTIGDIYARSGDLPPALDAHRRAISLAKGDPRYWHSLALFSVQYGVQMEEIGLPAVQKAIGLAPKEAIFVDTLGWIYFNLAREDEAEEAFFDALELDPNLGIAHLHLGFLYLKRNHLNLANSHLLQAREFSFGTLVGEQATELLEKYFQE